MEGIPVSGQDGDHAALNRVASARRPCRSGRTRAISAGGRRDRRRWRRHRDGDIDGAVEWTTPGGTTMNARSSRRCRSPQDNLSVVVDAGWITQDAVPGRHRRPGALQLG
jgi:D-xylose transport system substrate-binding protein